MEKLGAKQEAPLEQLGPEYEETPTPIAVQLATGEPVKSKYLGHADEVLHEGEEEGGEKVRQTAFEDDDDEYEVCYICIYICIYIYIYI